MNDLTLYEHLFQDPQAMLRDLEQAEVTLHATTSGKSLKPGGVTLGVHKVQPGEPAVAAKLTLASKLVEQKSLLKNFHDAGSAQRQELFQSARLKLYSIIFEHYRPGPAFRVGHGLPPNAMAARLVADGPTWESIVNGKPLTAWARHAVRLDNALGHRGSGTLLAHGQLLTAQHVIRFPGHLFGMNGKDPALAELNRVVDGAAVALKLANYSMPSPLDFAWISASVDWPGKLAETEFADALVGLPLQSTPLSKQELAGRKVAVVGHPAVPKQTEVELAALVYQDADLTLSYKRFMPGMLHPEDPLRESASGVFLRHDCSTLAGASGACLIDLETGVILGVHVSGKSSATNEDWNRAVPAWLIDSSLAPNII